jgi:hypothetical protein
MTKYILPFIALLVIACQPEKKPRSLDELLKFDKYPLPVIEENSLMAKWEKKPVIESVKLDDMEKDTGWKITGIGEMSYTNERSKDGKRSLRFRTSMRDEEFYKKNRTEWGSFGGSQGGSSSVRLQFSEPQDWSAYTRLSFWVYVHPTSMPTYSFNINLKNEGSPKNATTPSSSHHIQDLKPGEWNHIMFEMHHLKRDRISEFVINQILRGHNPEEEGIVTYDIDQLELQKVNGDYFEGWGVAPGKISFSHIGYRQDDPKIALAGEGAGNEFTIVSQEENVVFTGTVKEITTGKGKFSQIDFSDFKTPGFYFIKTGTISSQLFPIDNNVWIQPLFKALNFFFCERCGFNVPGVHLECHKDWQGFKGDVKKVINGGWHDAGDLSQGSWRTAMAALAMMNNLEKIEGKAEYTELANRLRDEIAWGLEWLLKTRFGEGYHMSFSVMRIYTDNKIGTIDDVASPARNVPWENFLAAAVQCKASAMLEKSHPQLAADSKTAALEDWKAAYESRKKWDQADYREASWGATSSLMLAAMTGDKKYLEHAAMFGNLIVKCQEQSFPEGIPITGYFYENTDRKIVIHNLHAAFEEAPLIALTMLCRELPRHENFKDWYTAVVLHSEYFMKRGAGYAAPYNHLPNSVWKESDVLAVTDSAMRADMLRQFNDGTKLKGEYVLRTFPIYRDGLFHGNTNIHMSSSWALAEASRLRNDAEGMALVGQQLRWVFGNNPFSMSLMYGEGYDFAPHFAYCLKDLVGALPVGMDCMNGDMPHWAATNNATSKEIWVEPVNRFMGTLAIYNNFIADKSSGNNTLKIEYLSTDEKDGSPRFRVDNSGDGSFYVKFTNARVAAVGPGNEKIFKIMIIDKNKPYVGIVALDKEPSMFREIYGTAL